MRSWAQTQIEWEHVRPFVVYGLVPALLVLALVKAFLVTHQYGYDISDSGAYDLIAVKLLDGWRLYRDLERHRVRLVIFDAHPDQPWLDGISPREDSPVLANWILDNYAPRELAGGYRMYWRRRAETPRRTEP